MDNEDLANFSAINRSVRNQKDFTEMSIANAKPVERYMFQVRKALDKFKTGLADQTQVENMVAHITQRYMRKYAADDAEVALNQKI